MSDAPERIWPDFSAPPKYENPDPRWQDPALPDFRLIWKVARECGYAVGLHGSMKRDCDMIAAPWTDEAVIAFDLIERLCVAMNAKVVGPISGKPHGRLGWNLQVDGYVKVIDISVLPRTSDTPAIDLDAIRREARNEVLREVLALPRYEPDVTESWNSGRSQMAVDHDGEWISRDAITAMIEDTP